MEIWPCCWWSSLWIVVFLLKSVSTRLSPETKYFLSKTEAAFEQAMSDCSPGSLPTLATEHDVHEIFQFLNKSKSFQTNQPIWIGLRKSKFECIIPSLPLKGFSWVKSNSPEESVLTWLAEPTATCTEDLCGALKQQTVQSDIKWGLIHDSCKTPHQFICKGGRRGSSVESSRPPSVEPQPKTATAETRLTTLKPDPVTAHPYLPTLGPESCERSKNPKHPSIRSLTPVAGDSSRVLVECWSEVKIDMSCSGSPAVWRLLNGSPANFSIICQQCENGFQKDVSGVCVDVDECSTGNPCQHTCLNTEGSYRCVCAADLDSSCEEVTSANDKNSLSSILIPILAVVAVLVVILAIIGVVKCCLKRREKKRTKP